MVILVEIEELIEVPSRGSDESIFEVEGKRQERCEEMARVSRLHAMSASKSGTTRRTAIVWELPASGPLPAPKPRPHRFCIARRAARSGEPESSGPGNSTWFTTSVLTSMPCVASAWTRRSVSQSDRNSCVGGDKGKNRCSD